MMKKKKKTKYKNNVFDVELIKLLKKRLSELNAQEKFNKLNNNTTIIKITK
jgi:hypothetical protein